MKKIKKYFFFLLEKLFCTMLFISSFACILATSMTVAIMAHGGRTQYYSMGTFRLLAEVSFIFALICGVFWSVIANKNSNY